MKVSMRRGEKETSPAGDATVEYGHDAVPVNSQKSRWERSWPTIACGAGKRPHRPFEMARLPCMLIVIGLFSDGYLNGCVRSSTIRYRKGT